MLARLKLQIKLLIDALLISSPSDPKIALMALEDLQYLEDKLLREQNDSNY